ncbi:cell division protein FtsQ/DivIB [Desulfobacterium sp. N47]|uniref:POTRA domain-containing protein n=1 Tax=uncultured Desulfobacterium sp. TaxID=201089 RepID=E1YBV7_9BACT|nr:hypothetical protein N47_G33750 [uncultured Desulfobacterium sp.]
MEFKRSRNKTHKNRFNRKRRIASVKERIVFNLKIIFILTLVPALSIVFIFIHDCITQSEYFTAKTIEIKGNLVLSKEEILKKSGINPGDSIFAINISKVRRNILANPWMAEVEVTRKIPSSITITVKEHNCLAVVDLGKKYLLNDQGNIFKYKENSEAEGLPLIQGLSYSDFDLNGRRTTAFDAVKTVLTLGLEPECILPNSKIKLIQVDREIGLTLIAFDENRIIKLGYGNYQGKYERLKNVCNQVNNEMNFQNFETIYLDNGLYRIVICPAIELPSDEIDNSVEPKTKSREKQAKFVFKSPLIA